MRLAPSSVHRIVVETSAGQRLNATMLLHCTSLQAEADLSELRRRIFAGGVVPPPHHHHHVLFLEQMIYGVENFVAKHWICQKGAKKVSKAWKD